MKIKKSRVFKKIITFLIGGSVLFVTMGFAEPLSIEPPYSKPWIVPTQATTAVFSQEAEMPNIESVKLFKKGKRLKRFGKKFYKINKKIIKHNLCKNHGICKM